MKVIISTGQGRLHLIESAKNLYNHAIDVRVITGWMPNIPDKLLNIIGRIIGRNNLAYGFKKRKEFPENRINSCGFSEFFLHFLFIPFPFKLLKKDNALVIGWKQFGKQSKQYISDAQIFHVRSGAGQGGAINQARKNGMKILVDHSAAHPQATYSLLKKAGLKDEDISINPNSAFWQLIMKDCDQADILLVNSDYVKETFINNKYDENKMRIAYLGVREDFWNLKDNWDLKSPIRLLFTGNFCFLKGGKLILDCLRQLQDIGFDYHLDVVGNINLPIPDWVKNSDNIVFHGHVPQEDIKLFLKESDIYIFPSYSEGSAQSLKEAMSAGMPVIATRQSGAPIIHLENGYLVPDNSSEAIKNAILELKENNKLRKKIGAKAAETIAKEHTWDNYATNVIDIYKELLKQ